MSIFTAEENADLEREFENRLLRPSQGEIFDALVWPEREQALDIEEVERYTRWAIYLWRHFVLRDEVTEIVKDEDAPSRQAIHSQMRKALRRLSKPERMGMTRGFAGTRLDAPLRAQGWVPPARKEDDS